MPEPTTDLPRIPLNRARITEAALALADRHGVEKLTMRSLAAELSVEAMSLYNHMRNKDDLLDAMVEAVVSAIELPRADAEWRNEMRQRARSMRSVLLAHPWAAQLITGRINVGPSMLTLIDTTMGCLYAAGFTYPEVDHVSNALDSYIYGFHLLERNFPLQPGEYVTAAQRFLPELPVERYPHMHALARMVADGIHDGVNDFEFGLDLLLEALEARRGRS